MAVQYDSLTLCFDVRERGCDAEVWMGITSGSNLVRSVRYMRRSGGNYTAGEWSVRARKRLVNMSTHRCSEKNMTVETAVRQKRLVRRTSRSIQTRLPPCNMSEKSFNCI